MTQGAGASARNGEAERFALVYTPEFRRPLRCSLCEAAPGSGAAVALFNVGNPSVRINVSSGYPADTIKYRLWQTD
jgi:hypothetical protein